MLNCLFTKKTYYHFFSKIVYVIQLQLFLTLVSLPILLAWNLPISVMSVIGNIFFAPFLTFFLLISSLLFFSELLSIPNGWLVVLLEYGTKCWSWFIFQGSQQWLIGLFKPSFVFLFLIMVLTWFIVYLKNKWNYALVTGSFFVLLATTVLILKLSFLPPFIISEIPCNGGVVTLINCKGAITVIDPGVMGKRINNSWVEYTLQKELIKQFGATSIANLIIMRPSVLTMEYAYQICCCMKVSTVYLNVWKGNAEAIQLKKYGRLRYELEKRGGVLKRIGTYAATSFPVNGHTITMMPLPKMISYKETQFPSIQCDICDEKNRLVHTLISS